jgi:hypothetical protein
LGLGNNAVWQFPARQFIILICSAAANHFIEERACLP